MMGMKTNMPKLIWKRMEQLDLFKEEEKEEFPPSWGEVVRDPESVFISDVRNYLYVEYSILRFEDIWHTIVSDQ